MRFWWFAIFLLNMQFSLHADPRSLIQSFLRQRYIEGSKPPTTTVAYYGMSLARFKRMIEKGVLPPGPSSQFDLVYYHIHRARPEDAFILAGREAILVARRDAFFSKIGVKNYTKYSATETDAVDRIYQARARLLNANLPAKVRETYLADIEDAERFIATHRSVSREAITAALESAKNERGVVVGLNAKIRNFKSTPFEEGFSIRMKEMPYVREAGTAGIPYHVVDAVFKPTAPSCGIVTRLLGVSH